MGVGFMNKYFKFFYCFIFISLFFIPFKVHAENLTGTYQFNYALGNNLVQPEYDPNYASSHSPSQTFPNSTTIPIPGVTDPNGGYYTFVKRMYITNYQSFTAGRRYRLTYQLQFDGYVTWTDYYSWGLYPNRSISCDANYGTVYYCSTNFNPQNNVSPYYLTIDVQFSQDVTISQFAIGNISNSRDFVLWNRGGSAQGFRIYTATYEDITSPEPSPSPSPSPSQDLTDIENGIDEVNDNLEDLGEGIESINDSITDSSTPSSNDTEDFLDNLNDITINNPISAIMTLPLQTVSKLYGIITTGIDDGCSPVLLIDFGGITNNNNNKIYLPCFNGIDYFGNTIWYIIDLFVCFYMFYNIVMLFIHVYFDIVTLSVSVSGSSHIMNSESPQTSPYGRR